LNPNVTFVQYIVMPSSSVFVYISSCDVSQYLSNDCYEHFHSAACCVSWD